MTQQVVVVLELFAADVTAEVLDEDLVDGANVAFQRLRRGEDIAALVTMELHASRKTTTGATLCVNFGGTTHHLISDAHAQCTQYCSS